MAGRRAVTDPQGPPTGSRPGQRPFSLRGRLLLSATLVLVIALGLVGVALDAAHYRGAVTSLQMRMESYVYQVLAALEVDPSGRLRIEADFADPRLRQPGSGVYIRVQGERDRWTSDSSLVLEWPPAPAVAPGRSLFSEPAAGEDFFSYHYGVGWQLPDGRILPLTISVRVEADELEQQTGAFRRGLWRSLGAAGLILVLAQALLFFLGFRPLRQVAQDVARVESGRAPRLEGRYPRELEPLARNVNRLLDTEKSNRERIRNALDSLAHSLKTPLAVIQAGLQVDSAESRRSMQQAAEEMNRLIRTRLERAGATARRTLAAPVPVEPQLQRVIASLQKVYSQKMMATDVRLPQGLAFYGEQRDLLELLGNLLDNAFKYGRKTVRISAGLVDAAASRPGLWLRVEDDGPGIVEAHWERLLQRGARGDEHIEGHGLGLAIVVELVTAYGGELSIGVSDLGGAMVTVTVPGN